MGIGRMYGPISPPTNAIGKTAAMTAQVARIVGLPDLGDGFDSDLPPRTSLILRQVQVTRDIFHHD